MRAARPAEARIVAARVAAMRAYLEGLARANVALMRARRYPPLYSGRVRWNLREVRPLPTIGHLVKAGVGACGPLAAARAAELRLRGVRATVDVRRTGDHRWHAFVRLPGGAVEDPSKRLGMVRA